MEPRFKGCSIWIENDDHTFSLFDDRAKTFTAKEFKKFQALQSLGGYGTILIVKPKPHEITNPSYIPYKEPKPNNTNGNTNN